MLKLENSQYLNSIFQLNYTRYEKTLSHKIVHYKKIYESKLKHFHIRCISFYLIKKNTIENLKFNFLTIICEIGKKRKLPKLFVLIKSRNCV